MAGKLFYQEKTGNLFNPLAMKNDHYRRVRGGTSQIIEITCAQCGAVVLTYQKDGIGTLARCYLNRILSPAKYEKLQREANDVKGLSCLQCDCGNMLGIPMVHSDGRLAFRLVRGRFKRKKV